MALNKIDRLYEWKPNKHKDVRDVLGQYSDSDPNFRINSDPDLDVDQALELPI